ncbi:MAG TPA: class I SAM-dependent methyltransferase [Myxococcota bacterium]|nr:class I SAM-dependent methyltransferase [Myxococcota bacterium]
MENQSYYDVMSKGYEKERHHGYHAWLDRAEIDTISDLIRGRDVLEVGCGTGLMMTRIAPIARHVTGVDLSAGMLEKARERGLNVMQADATKLPFADASFDAAVSFKVLAHIENIQAAMSEMCRVVRPGGIVAAEFYNRHSIRSLIKFTKKPSEIGAGVVDTDVFTRYDSISQAESYFPQGMEIIRVRGIRTVIPAAVFMKIPVLDRALGFQDAIVSRTPFGRLGGFVVVVARKA